MVVKNHLQHQKESLESLLDLQLKHHWVNPTKASYDLEPTPSKIVTPLVLEGSG